MLAAVLDRGAVLSEEDAGLDAPAARAEARGLADLACRRLGQIDAVLMQAVPRAPRGPVPHILRVMAAELLFREGADHAAVDLAVRQVKALPGAGGLAGMVNAVGRRIARGELTPPADPMTAMAPWLAERLIADWGAETTAAIAASHLHPAPHDLTARDPADAAALAEALEAEHLETGTVRLANRPQLSALPGYEDGRWWAQDAAAALPAVMLGQVRGKRVLDLCAAPGGKTLQLAAMGATVTALDRSEARLDRLRQNLSRTGLEATIVAADALEWRPDEPFDAILLDAPCSATGTVRRHPDLPWRRESLELEPLTAAQDRLLDEAWTMLAPGARLVYAVCSLLKAEGEERALAFAERTPDARPAEAPVPQPFLGPEGWLRTRPDMWAGRGGLDGFFAAAFDKP